MIMVGTRALTRRHPFDDEIIFAFNLMVTRIEIRSESLNGEGGEDDDGRVGLGCRENEGGEDRKLTISGVTTTHPPTKQRKLVELTGPSY